MTTCERFMFLFLAIIITIFSAFNVITERDIDHLQSEVQMLQAKEVNKGSTEFYTYDIQTALTCIKENNIEKLTRYCEVNNLDYEALISLLVSKGYLEPGVKGDGLRG